jgi:hypothetical protein
MSKLKLNAIAAQALLDNDFQTAILNGKYQDKLGSFRLNEEESHAVMSINALSVDQFVRSLGNLMQSARVIG